MTQSAIDAAKAENLLAVEMEAAGLYALAEAKRLAIVCFAHVTNQMGMVSDDFEKGAHNGAEACLDLLTAVSGWWQSILISRRNYNYAVPGSWISKALRISRCALVTSVRK